MTATDRESAYAGPVIALVTSAGGLDALSRVLTALPRELAACVLVLMHLDPDFGSRLAEILDTRCPLTVRVADHDTPLRVGAVFVAAAGRHLLVAPTGRLGAITSGDFPPSRPSADLLLTSLALAVGSRAIAVILTGGGHDGATGATAIHHYGGVVLATNQASSQNFTMPAAAIALDAVDEILDLDTVAARLTELVAVDAVRPPKHSHRPPEPRNQALPRRKLGAAS